MTSAPAASHRVAVRSVATAVVVAVSLLLLVVAASAGPVTLFHATAPPVVQMDPLPVVPAPSVSSVPTYHALTKYDHAVVDLSWLGTLLMWAVVAVLAVVLARALPRGVPRAGRRRWRAPPRPDTVESDVLPTVTLAEALADDDEARREVVERGEVRDAVVACWLRLEEVVARCGVARRPAETSTELVTRVLRALDVDPRAVGSLAGLYHEARFSSHLLTEESRAAARSALEALQRDLPTPGRVA